jgi:hypothetical protein
MGVKMNKELADQIKAQSTLQVESFELSYIKSLNETVVKNLVLRSVIFAPDILIEKITCQRSDYQI